MLLMSILKWDRFRLPTTRQNEEATNVLHIIDIVNTPTCPTAPADLASQ
jgi:hypothetical protein